MSGLPKQYAVVGGRPLLWHTLSACLNTCPDVLAVVIRPDDASSYATAIGELSGNACMIPAVYGGATRQESVRLGLEALAAAAPDIVLIHDAARPYVTAGLVQNLVKALGQNATANASPSAGAIAAAPVADTLKRVTADGVITETIARDSLWSAQTPQAFKFSTILDAHRKAAAAGRTDFTDDASLFEWLGIPVAVVPSTGMNKKVTTAADLSEADAHFSVRTRFETRTGSGFDVHRFVAGDHVWLCGVRLDCDQRLDGHSDADVGLHALVDALLGAIGDGDIGEHFPPSDPQWRGAASRLFLEDAGRRVAARGGRIVNVDVTILCETPRIGPHRSAMRKVIADTLGLTIDRVGVKATTTEQLGFTGRREGIAALASASVELPLPV